MERELRVVDAEGGVSMNPSDLRCEHDSQANMTNLTKVGYTLDIDQSTPDRLALIVLSFECD